MSIDLIHLSAATSVKFTTDPDDKWKAIYKDIEFNQNSLHFYFFLSNFSYLFKLFKKHFNVRFTWDIETVKYRCLGLDLK